MENVFNIDGNTNDISFLLYDALITITTIDFCILILLRDICQNWGNKQ